MAENEEKDSADESTPAAADPTPGADALVAGSDQSGARSPEVNDEDEIEATAQQDDLSEPGPSSVESSHDVDGEAVSDDAEPDELPAELLDEEPLSDDEESHAERDRELVGVGARTAGESASGRGRSKKDKATPRQRRGSDRPQRTTPVQFVKESVGELRKVVYPTGSQLANYFVVVLVFVLFIIAFVGLLDLGLGWAIFKVFS